MDGLQLAGEEERTSNEDCFVFPDESQGKPLLILCPRVGKEMIMIMIRSGI